MIKFIWEWYQIANKLDGCLCPTCQTGKNNLTSYPDYCPHTESLKIVKTSCDPRLGVRTIGDRLMPMFECLFYVPVKKEET